MPFCAFRVAERNGHNHERKNVFDALRRNSFELNFSLADKAKWLDEILSKEGINLPVIIDDFLRKLPPASA